MKPFGGIASICRIKKVTVLAIVLLIVGLSVFILYPGNNALSFSKELVVIDNLSDDNPEAASVRLNAMRTYGGVDRIPANISPNRINGISDC